MKKYLEEDQRGPECRGFHPHRVGVHHPPGSWMSSPTQKLPELHTLWVCMAASSCRHHGSLIPFPTTLPFLEGVNGHTLGCLDKTSPTFAGMHGNKGRQSRNWARWLL